MDPADEFHSPYVYVGNNPVYMLDPNGMWAGDYYKENGDYLGSDGIIDDKVYIAENSNFENAVELDISHSDFLMYSATVYAESSGELKESAAIASVIMNRSNYKNESITSIIKNTGIYGYNSKPCKSIYGSKSNSNSKLVGARSGIINALKGGKDYSNGAYFWEG